MATSSPRSPQLTRYQLASARLAVDHACQQVQSALFAVTQALSADAAAEEAPPPPSRLLRDRLEALRQGQPLAAAMHAPAERHRSAA